MTVAEATKTKSSSGVTRSGRLFALELRGDRIHSMNPDGSDRKIIVTDCRHREGMRVMRANLDGSRVETLVETGRGDKDVRDQTKWCVGITVDPRPENSTGRKRAPITAGGAASSAPTSISRKARARRTAPTSKCCSIACLSRSTLSSI